MFVMFYDVEFGLWVCGESWLAIKDSLTRTSSNCSPAIDCKVQIYLFQNVSFAALFHIEYSSYESLVWHTRVFYLIVLIEHIINWNIQTRFSGEHPKIHGVRLSVAYSNRILNNLLRISIEGPSPAAFP